MEFRENGDVYLPGPHRFDPALSGTFGHRRFAIGLDLGQARDPAALSIIRDEQHPLAAYDASGKQMLGPRHLTVVFLERYRNQDYVALARHVGLLLNKIPLTPQTARLAIDATGPGRPFHDVLTEIGVPHVPVQMTSGAGWSKGEDGYINASKSFLFYHLAGHLETRRLQVANGLPLAKEFLQELSDFETKMSAAGNLLVDVASQDHHGDMTVATAIALFLATSLKPGFTGEGKLDNYFAYA